MLSTITKSLVDLALLEDLGPGFSSGSASSGDITSQATLEPDRAMAGKLIARSDLIVCGHEVAEYVFRLLDPNVTYEIVKPDGSSAHADEVLSRFAGNARAMLSAERTVLNFMQRMSGIATKTHQVVKRIEHTGAKILDTRKTAPGFRELDKYAVLVGGGTNHRIGLYDAVLIKNNHVDAIGGDIAEAIRKCRSDVFSGVKVQCEVRNTAELEQALTALPDAILLDNMTPDQLRAAVALVRLQPATRHIQLEASGGITLATVQEFAEAGVDFISLGELTHSVTAADISLRYEKQRD